MLRAPSTPGPESGFRGYYGYEYCYCCCCSYCYYYGCGYGYSYGYCYGFGCGYVNKSGAGSNPRNPEMHLKTWTSKKTTRATTKRT